MSVGGRGGGSDISHRRVEWREIFFRRRYIRAHFAICRSSPIFGNLERSDKTAYILMLATGPGDIKYFTSGLMMKRPSYLLYSRHGGYLSTLRSYRRSEFTKRRLYHFFVKDILGAGERGGGANGPSPNFSITLILACGRWSPERDYEGLLFEIQKFSFTNFANFSKTPERRIRIPASNEI